MLEIVDGILRQVCQVVLGLLDIHLDVGNLLLGFLDVELRNLAHRLLAQFQHLLARNLLAEQFPVGVKTALDAGNLILPCGKVLFLQDLVYALLEENLLQRHPVPAVFQLGKQYLQFLLQQVFGMECGVPQYVAGSHELRLVVDDDARLRRKTDLAVGKSIHPVNRLVGRDTVGQIADYLHLGSRVVVHLLDADFLLLVGFENALYQHVGGDGIGYLGDDDGLALFVIVHLGADAQPSAQCRVVVFRHVNQPARGEVGVYLERLVLQHMDGSLHQLAEVIRQDVRGQGDSNALGALCQQQGELDGQGDGLLFAAVVTGFPLCGLGVEHHLLGELREARLNITPCSCAVAGKYVAPVTLAVNQQVLLPQVH